MHLVDRNTIVGIDLLAIGVVVAALGYIGAQSIPIAGFGLAVAIIGALVLLIVPEPIPQDAFKALLKDSITNIEILLEESHLKERAYFLRTDDAKVRAFIPITVEEQENAKTLLTLNKAPKRLLTNYGDLKGLMLIPPGNEIVKLAKIQKGDDLEESLRSALIGFSDLATSVLAIEDGNKVKVEIKGVKIFSESPFFMKCLGSPISSVASCVISSVKGEPVRIQDEKFDKALVRLTVEVIS